MTELSKEEVLAELEGGFRPTRSECGIASCLYPATFCVLGLGMPAVAIYFMVYLIQRMFEVGDWGQKFPVLLVIQPISALFFVATDWTRKWPTGNTTLFFFLLAISSGLIVLQALLIMLCWKDDALSEKFNDSDAEKFAVLLFLPFLPYLWYVMLKSVLRLVCGGPRPTYEQTPGQPRDGRDETWDGDWVDPNNNDGEGNRQQREADQISNEDLSFALPPVEDTLVLAPTTTKPSEKVRTTEKKLEILRKQLDKRHERKNEKARQNNEAGIAMLREAMAGDSEAGIELGQIM